ncbi:MAG: EAL domain-containing protein [Chitinophagaceae bacterium]|nr:EAL domain-containing protein [Rubrivivax sp.]
MISPDELRALHNELALFRLVANAVPVAIAYYERHANTCRYANREYAAMFGRDEASIVGLPLTEIIGQAASDRIQPQVDRVVQDLVAINYERELVDAEGDTRYIEVNLLPHVGEDGQAVGAFVLIADITRHRRAEAALRESEERLAKFMHASAEGIVFHKGGLITDVNPPLLALLGWTLPEMLGRPTLDFVAPDQRQQVAEVIAAAPEITYDSAVLHRDGTRIPVQFIVRTVRHGDEVLRMTIVRDIRDRIEAQARIHHLAHHDPLTGLPNRLDFIGRLQAQIDHAMKRGETMALLFIDLDHFKRVNDSLGHPVGDMLLQTVAQRITGALRGGDLVARFGGDEFVLLLAGNPSPQAVQDVADKLLAAIGAPLEVSGASISVSPSIGVALCPRDGNTPDTLIKHADTAMYHAKAQGRAHCRFFEPAMEEAVMAALAMESRLAQAIRDHEFVLHFQPQLTLADGSLRGVEALVRWQHPARGLVGPDEFIPLAEARRLILPIGQWVLHEALRCAVAWQRAGLLAVPMAVNLSSAQFQATGFVESIQRLLAEAGAEGRQLELELTERMLMEDVPAVRATLLRLAALGVGLAVDDFGTGYTSLAHLKDLPIHCLKIDRSFIHELPADRGAAAIARAIVEMARSLGLRVVAEGVETQAQHDWALVQGCDAQQGFFDARPMAADAFETWLRARRIPGR